MTGPTARTCGAHAVVPLAFAGIVAALMQTLVVPLIRALPDLLGATESAATWVVTATLPASAVNMPIAGRLGDVFGRRRVLLLSLLPIAAGCAVCALSGSLVPMVVGRALQGLGMGVVPLGVSLLPDLVPPARTGSAMAVMSASMGVGGAVGLPMVAALDQFASWRVTFWIAAGLALLAALSVAVAVAVPADPARTTGPRPRLDLVGAAGLAVGLTGALLVVSRGTDWGWTSAPTLLISTCALAVLVLWTRWERRCAAPLVDLRTATRRPVLLTNLASALVGFALYAQSLAVPQLLQLPVSTGYGLGQSMLAMGL